MHRKNTLLIFSFLCVIALFSSLANSSEVVPRAYLITHNDSAAVIVGESHVYTQLEFDDYYERIVKPSFQAAQVALLESYFGPENQINVGYNLYAPCESGERLSEQLRPHMDELIAATRQANLDVPNWMSGWWMFPEVALVSGFLPDFSVHKVEAAIKAERKNSDDDAGVSYRLRADAAHHKRPHIKGLDTVVKVREHFCNASAEHRQDYAIATVDSIIGRLHMLEDAKKTGVPFDFSKDKFNDVISAWGCVDNAVPCTYPVLASSNSVNLLTRYGLNCPNNAGFFKLSIQDRTHAWLPQILDAMQNNRRTIVVVGALHLPDLHYGDQDYPGLLTLLRQQGCTVKAIHAEQDIEENFLKKRWWEALTDFIY